MIKFWSLALFQECQLKRAHLKVKEKNIAALTALLFK